MILIKSISFAAILGTLFLLGCTDLLGGNVIEGSIITAVSFGGIYSAARWHRPGWKQFCFLAVLIYVFMSVEALTHFAYVLAIPYGVLAWVSLQEYLLPKLWFERKLIK